MTEVTHVAADMNTGVPTDNGPKCSGNASLACLRCGSTEKTPLVFSLLFFGLAYSFRSQNGGDLVNAKVD